MYMWPQHALVKRLHNANNYKEQQNHVAEFYTTELWEKKDTG